MPGVMSRRKVEAPPELAAQWTAQLTDHVIDLCWSPGGSLVAAAAVDGPVSVFDADTGERKFQFEGHEFGTVRIAWSPNSKTPVLASCGQDGQARLWDCCAGRCLAELDGGAAWVERLAWSPRGEFLATAAGRKLRMWDGRTGALLQAYADHASTIADIAWKPGADELAACGYNGLTFWSPSHAEMLRRFEWKGSMLKLAWSPDARYIATGNQDSTVQFWIIATGKELQMWGYRAKIRELAWDPRSRYLATSGAPVAVVWDCSGKGPAGTKPLMLAFHERLLTQVVFQSEGNLLATGCEEGFVAVWRPGKEEIPIATAHVDAAVGKIAWSPSNRRLAVGNAQGEVKVFRAP